VGVNVVTAPILKTKLYIPPLRPKLVSRPRLIRRLDEGLHLGHKLTLVSAQAGFGKTTLLSEWAHHLHSPEPNTQYPISNTAIAWLSLDENDDDPIRFWSYAIAALQTVHAGVGQEALVAFGAPQPPPLEALLAALINELTARPDPFCLVLDDYHAVKSSAIHRALAFLIEHQPPHMHLALATRSDPPLPIARLRGRGQMTELRVHDLRFTADEAAAFLNEVAGLGLSAGDVAALEARTEGWITGLQLAALALQAALSMQGREDVQGFIRAFTGSNRYVLDYLTEEVLKRQPEGVQSFLLDTSILERLSGPLCDAVCFGRAETPGTGGTPAQAGIPGTEMLAALEQANLFLVPLDGERRWYRYHRLFADLLRARAADLQPERLPGLHSRASTWYEENGLLDEAVHHALAAGDLARVGGLIEAHGMPMLMRGELTTLLRWIAALPEERIQASARICVLHAWALLLTGQVGAIESRLRTVERLQQAAPAGDLQGEIATIRAYVAAQQGDVERTIALARLALERLDPSSHGVRAIVSFVLGGACLLRGDVAAAAEALREAGTVGLQGGNVHIVAPALNALAGVQMLQGHLRQARTTAQEAINLATGPDGRLLPIAAGPTSALAELAYEWNDLEGALAYARQSVELSQRWGSSDTLCHGYLTLAQVLQARGDLEAVEDALCEAERVGSGIATTPLFPLRLRVAWAHLWLARGNLEAAGRWLEDAAWDPADLLHAPAVLAAARVRLALGQPGAALQGLASLLEQARAQDLDAVAIEALALQALAHRALGDSEHALEVLAEALSLAEAEEFVRRFVDEGEPMRSLLLDFRSRIGRRASRVGVGDAHRLLAYANRLLAAYPGAQPATAATLAQGLVEPLSERELEVLNLIAVGFSNREIAEELVIAVSTVKSHTNHIFGKLAVQSRTQAVARAQELGLLPAPGL
jgi:LuxR family maltose regulon positive regulatory protein